MATSPRLMRLFLAITFISVICMLGFYHQKLRKVATHTEASSVKICQSLNASGLMQDAKIRSSFIASNMDKIYTIFEQMDNVLRNEKKTMISFLSGPIINNHNFQYFHNPESTCTDSPTEILIVVPSAPGNFEKRQNIRNGEYGTFVNVTENQTKLLFFIGMAKVDTIQRLIDQESNTYQDIVQESYEDIYHNIRYKAVSMLKWASTLCLNAKYVIRIDDDMEANLASIVTAVRRAGSKYSNFILGSLRLKDRHVSAVNNKLLLPNQEYPEAALPPYALTILLGYPILTAELLYQAAQRVTPIWLNDLHIIGICAPKVGVKLLSDPQFTSRQNSSSQL